MRKTDSVRATALAFSRGIGPSVGFFMTFFPQFLLGNAGMPRRHYNYDPQFQALHVISTVGSWILGGGMLLTLVYLAVSVFTGDRAPPDPWDSRGFEWRTASPPPTHNFDPSLDLEATLATGPYDYATLPREPVARAPRDAHV